ncbi:MAG: UDP-N-acetylmuramate--L-alanine ligase [Candidatus Sungbacteria bacterium RIFCSPLOWO2_02_FULL_54_10]|uniref:UDP-N-acetylmuramate--L-alanine ligase n=2 Tax=Candidatus Sungiibacteriota TaxID=1817917 RepID=A0A1G2L939_9BACT|nr:MAG: UDP-N-acetylmuramate--L-alanine ligase [Candidatus Sungbacteria bacterium RIFCSPHIGHO2_01_FULL_54_26]OHA04123.1 MAG: UDP-N-acetylmuramate--L-alanine ligase [Candidatus Sungbacteria bacterium RIFCSPHIGHO2_02_FULL_53_17]OHA07371.1 MAG: UDP-N-acetylmuramate--L-alanine ligase [Candidatus Sungbacteria bacterium RIFCSPLOWO2_01_FULL_54_21]OHA12711.1 MAG: UDP-N-acetylmuramate--L-alanine ligase [Candidatus Sungbacteria bacterium RIFCSPLOWO2_02_FULL_54_10]
MLVEKRGKEVYPAYMEHVHFIGVGGIGVSALARYYLSIGATVSGSDLVASEITRALAEKGATVIIGNHAALNLLSGATRVIYTAATPQTNPELKEAKRRKLSTQTYAEAVGDLTRQYRTVTISGSHGKSTTTAMTSLVMEAGYLDPTVIIGTKVREFGDSNFRSGKGSHLVLEADEWNKSFLHYSPHVAVVTNIDAEHLDTYKTVEAVEQAFSEYLGKVPQDGTIIANADDSRLAVVAKKFGPKVAWYSVKDMEAKKVKPLLKVPGTHNLSNALAALTAGRVLGVLEPDILRALSQFRGTWRRFEMKGLYKGAHLVSDYGHHPREIMATLSAAREHFPMRRIWCVFQPHQYQRLKYLWNDFLSAFDMADRVVLLPVYDVAGREILAAKKAVNSLLLAEGLQERGKDAWHSASFPEARQFLDEGLRRGDVLLVMGAGDIYDLTTDLANHTIEA